MNPELIIQRARSIEVKERLAQLVYQLRPNFWHWLYLLKLIPARALGETWFNHLTVLNAFAELERPYHYLEVGVNKGASLLSVLSQSPQVKARCFDLWPVDYAMQPGWPHEPSNPEFIIQEMRKFQPEFNARFYSGDSAATLPAFFMDNPTFMAGIALVDGDHSEAGAARDLESVWPHTKAIVFDDIKHPTHPYLERVWDQAFERHGRGWVQFKDYFHVGTACAFKVDAV